MLFKTFPILRFASKIEAQDKEGRTNESLRREYVITQLRKEVRLQTCRGQALLLSDVWERYQDLCKEESIAIPYYFLTRRAFFKEHLCKGVKDIMIVPKKSSALDDDILISSNLSQSDISKIMDDKSCDEEEFKIPSYQSSQMHQMVHLALHLKGLIQSHPINNKAELTEANAFAAVPEALYIFIALLKGGDSILDVDIDQDVDEQEYEAAWALRRSILNICQDLVFLVTDQKNIPPKQYSLGLTIQGYRSKKLTRLLHMSGQIMSYDNVCKADTALAQKTLQRMDKDTGTVLTA